MKETIQQEKKKKDVMKFLQLCDQMWTHGVGKWSKS